MPDTLFSYVLRYSKRQQLILIAMIVCAFPFYYLSLDLPKTIINDAITGSQFPVELAAEFFGSRLSFGSFDQVEYLILLCFLFLLLVVINGGFKYFINVYRGVLGERMLRRLRYQLIDRMMKFPLSKFRQTSQGELVSIVNQETEPLGGFIGEYFSLPLYQGGMMITILIFMFIQDWKLGIAAIALYPLQTWLIPKLQRQVNLLNQERIIHMRKLAENLGETVSGINDIRVNRNDNYFKARFSEQLGGIFNIRVQIFRKKFFIKFLNSFIGQITPFLFFLLGGLLVIRGELSFGALVAVLAAYKDLSPPWKELLTWYQLQADARMKFTLLIDQFQEINVETETETDSSRTKISALTPELELRRVSLASVDDSAELHNISFSIKAGEWVRVVGPGGSGKDPLAHILARLIRPTSGKLHLGGQESENLATNHLGHFLGYCGHDSYLFATSIQENLEFALKQNVLDSVVSDLDHDANLKLQRWLREAMLSGNSQQRADVDWTDYALAGASDRRQLNQITLEVLGVVNLEDELVQLALTKTIRQDQYPELVSGILQARELMRTRMRDSDFGLVVESLDADQYNDNASVAENILFGEAIDPAFKLENLANNPEIRTLLDNYDLTELFDSASLSIATTMVEIFADLPADHEFSDRYGLVDADEVVRLKHILSTLDSAEQAESIEQLELSGKQLFRSLPFRLVAARHRLGILTAEHKEKIIRIRKAIMENHQVSSNPVINFFDPASYSDSSRIGDNIIFGRVNFSRRGASDIVNRQLVGVLKELKLIPTLLEVGLAAPVGQAGSLLPLSRRQKITLARALLKQPDILVINEGLSALDNVELQSILGNIKRLRPNQTLIWIDSHERFTEYFDKSVILDSGKISRVDELSQASANADDSRKDLTQKTRQASSVQLVEKVELIRQIPIFRSLDRPSLQLIAKIATAVDIAQGERLFGQGEQGDALYVIVDGFARIVINSENQEIPICDYGANEVIGELAVLSEEPRTASVDAITDLVVLRIDRADFLDIVHSHSDVGYQLLQVISTKLVDVSRRVSADNWGPANSSGSKPDQTT